MSASFIELEREKQWKNKNTQACYSKTMDEKAKEEEVRQVKSKNEYKPFW